MEKVSSSLSSKILEGTSCLVCPCEGTLCWGCPSGGTSHREGAVTPRDEEPKWVTNSSTLAALDLSPDLL